MRVTAWIAMTPGIWFVKHEPLVNPHDWYGTIIRLHKLVFWIVI